MAGLKTERMARKHFCVEIAFSDETLEPLHSLSDLSALEAKTLRAPERSGSERARVLERSGSERASEPLPAPGTELLLLGVLQ